MPDRRIVLGEDDFEDETPAPAARPAREVPAPADAPTVRHESFARPLTERPTAAHDAVGRPSADAPTRPPTGRLPPPRAGEPGWPPPGAPGIGRPPAGHPGPQNGHPVPSGPGPRVGATLLDGLIIGVPATILYFVVLAVGTALIVDGIGDSDSDGIAAGLGLIVIVALVLPLVVGLIGLLYVMLTMNRPGPKNGQTVGRGVAGIRLLRLDGRPVTAGTAFLHDLLFPFLVRLAIALPFLVLIGVTSAEDSYSIAYDDVYYEEGGTSAGEIIGWIGWLLAGCAWLGYVWWSMSRDPLRRTPYDKWTRSMTATSFSTPDGALGRPLPVPGRPAPGAYGPGPPGPSYPGPSAAPGQGRPAAGPPGDAPPAGQRPLWAGSSGQGGAPVAAPDAPPAGPAALRLRRTDDG